MLKGERRHDIHSWPFDTNVVKIHCSALLFVSPGPLLTTNVNRKEPQHLNRPLLASLPNHCCDHIQSHSSKYQVQSDESQIYNFTLTFLEKSIFNCLVDLSTWVSSISISNWRELLAPFPLLSPIHLFLIHFSKSPCHLFHWLTQKF